MHSYLVVCWLHRFDYHHSLETYSVGLPASVEEQKLVAPWPEIALKMKYEKNLTKNIWNAAPLQRHLLLWWRLWRILLNLLHHRLLDNAAQMLLNFYCWIENFVQNWSWSTAIRRLVEFYKSKILRGWNMIFYKRVYLHFSQKTQAKHTVEKV